MEIITTHLLLVPILIFVFLNWKNNRKASALPAPAVTGGHSSPGHMLKKTWIGGDDETLAVRGWRWKCTCGVIGASTNASSKTNTLGSEENVINLFKIHATLYKEVNGNEWKDQHDALQVKFDTYVEKCYCKETNHELLPLKG